MIRISFFTETSQAKIHIFELEEFRISSPFSLSVFSSTQAGMEANCFGSVNALSLSDLWNHRPDVNLVFSLNPLFTNPLRKHGGQNKLTENWADQILVQLCACPLQCTKSNIRQTMGESKMRFYVGKILLPLQALAPSYPHPRDIIWKYRTYQDNWLDLTQ